MEREPERGMGVKDRYLRLSSCALPKPWGRQVADVPELATLRKVEHQ